MIIIGLTHMSSDEHYMLCRDNCAASTALPAGVVSPATNISSWSESESLTQEQAIFPKQQQTLCDSEAAHHHYTHLCLYLQRKRDT